MPPPSTFASAAAGNNVSNNQQTQARDSAADWARRTNGATQTFRRPSQPPSVSSTPFQEPGNAAATVGANNPAPRYIPPHRNGTGNELRYSKDQLLDLYRVQHGLGGLKEGLSGLYVAGWQPDNANGTASTVWGRSENNRDSQLGPDVCWDRDGSIEPLGLLEMDDEERDLFTTSVNTPLKPPTLNKENQQPNGMSSRKISVSGGGTPGGFGAPSPSLSRNPGRRRDTSDSYPFPSAQATSPTLGRDDPRAASPPPSLLRRRTDLKDLAQERESEAEDKGPVNPFGILKRNPTGPLSAGFNAPASPWSNAPQATAMPPMGSFGNFGLGAGQASASEKRPPLGAGRAESRFKNVLNKDIAEENKSTEPKLNPLNQTKPRETTDSWRSSTAHASDDDEFDIPSGSAALAANSDTSPPLSRATGRGFGTPSRANTHEDYGFGAFGMTTDNTHSFAQSFLPGRDGFQPTPSGQRGAQQIPGQEPMSPTDTNPYQSPEQYGVNRLNEENDTDASDGVASRVSRLGGFPQGSHGQFNALGGLGGFGGLNRAPGPPGAGADRSQTSSVGPSHGFGGLGGLGQLSGTPSHWPLATGGFGTPTRQSSGLTNAFGGGIFGGASGDVQSPGLAGLGSNILGPQMGGGRMTGMFGGGVLHNQAEREAHDERASSTHFGGSGDGPRDPDSPYNAEGQNPSNAKLGAETIAPGQGDVTAANQPPQPQQRTMVMPDRMRWIYRDPQGQTQGPWSGLEMHDWYKAGFFSPELLVKKYEDPEYEPLAQLIRRIGNSREPFLVPQIGIPHGPPSSAGPNAWAGGQLGANPGPAGGAQPPFASSFPSFGTTLTAEQQNALERRKQEEQYLMARQKEHLAQAQMAQRMHGHHGGGFMPGQLHHHSSAHSLHSQPSYGSITAPGGFASGGLGMGGLGTSIAPGQGFFDASLRQQPPPSQPPAGPGVVGAGIESLGHIREENVTGMIGRLDIGGHRGVPGQFEMGTQRTAHGQFGAPGQPYGQNVSGPGPISHEQQVKQMLADRAQLQEEQDEDQSISDDDESATNERLEEFQRLQGSAVATSTIEPPAATKVTMPINKNEQRVASEILSLTEQVQKAASAQESPVPGLPQPFPPPSQSPLPAPAAQRTGRQSFADHLQSESRDRSQTPSVDTPSVAIAPWAKETSDAPRGPSLKEIQEAEAKKAAEAEELATAVRRAAFQKEMEAQAAAAAASQPGLPATASWAAAGSPATPTSAVSPWAKTAPKTASGPAAAKSMAQIQKEEEARKRRLAAQQTLALTNTMVAVSNPAGSKSYANLASKVSLPPASTVNVGGSWTTVGAGGKTKTPGPPTPAAATRTVSSGILPSTPAATVRKPLQRSVTASGLGSLNAQDELRKWAVGELRPDLNKGISADEFVNGLFFLPLEPEMITEAVHGASNTIDSRHFAEEFIRRKKLADKGLIDSTVPPKSASPAHAAANQAGGWSEVAKKGPTKEPLRSTTEESNGSFRVVAAKRKAGKR